MVPKWRQGAVESLRRMAEFDLIARILAQAGTRNDVALGIGDDAAVLMPTPGQHLAVACDTLNVGVHFPVDAAAGDIGWKALAVNLSDLAAMGAVPAWALLSLSLPQADANFVESFMDGFSALAQQSGIALVGGDTTRGPLSVCVTALGFVPPGAALTRAGAQPGDAVFVSGTLGDAAAALRLPADTTDSPDARALRQRLNRPLPRLQLGQALRGHATAAIDVSDGLLADLAHVARASGVAIELEATRLPCSAALAACCDAATRLRWQATGGDDYELAFTLPPDRIDALGDLDVEVTRVGRVVDGEGVRLRDGSGGIVVFDQAGWEHFAGVSA